MTRGSRSFIAAQTSFFLATASADGQPYIQHRGGPAGFLHVLDEQDARVRRLRRQPAVSSRQGNLAENPKAHLFLIDYVNRQRIKIWGEAKVVEDDPELLAKLMPQGYKARPEQVIVFTITAWDLELPAAHPAELDAADVVAASPSVTSASPSWRPRCAAESGRSGLTPLRPIMLDSAHLQAE